VATACRLGSGRYTVGVDGAGRGTSWWDGLALTGIGPDDGLFVYLRDLDTDAVWCAGDAPLDAAPGRYAASRVGDVVRLAREHEGVVCTYETGVVPDADAEVRRLRLENASGRVRRIEVTTYVEIVLHDPAAHAAHPAFSKLFVETARDGEVLCAHRRPRSAGERTAWLAHALAGPGPLAWETDRVRFLGRGRSPAAPVALRAVLGGGLGPVLDPVCALRRAVVLAAGEAAELAIVLAAAASRAAAVATARAYADPAAARRVLEGVATGAPVALPVRPPLPPPRFVPAPRDPAPPAPAGPRFTDDGSAYAFAVDPASPAGRPPMPWVNVVANPGAGFLVSESGAGCTWSRNSRQNRLTPWANDPVVDPHDEALWMREEDAGVFWSPLPGPTPPPAPVAVEHGLGWSRWTLVARGLAQEVTTFVPRDAPVRVWRVRVTSERPDACRLSLFACFRLVLGVLPGPTIVTAWDAEADALLARNPANGEFADGVVVAAAVAPADAGRVEYTADRAAFLGPRGGLACPAAVAGGDPLDGRTGPGLDACAALRVPLVLAAGATVECAVVLGEATGAAAARELVAALRAPGAVGRALAGVQAFWRETAGALQVATPAPALDVLVNAWLPYQTLSCRLWGRSAFYQSGGAWGFRDQLQDAAALVWLRPDLTRAQILLHAAHQFPEGDVLHWWHPPADRGTRTRFSDDLLWLPWAVAGYVAATGDVALLDEDAGFVTARALAPGEDEAYLDTAPAAERASVWAHCCRALDRSLTRGAHGLPLMGTGDWNDGMNRVGREGRGESVWLGFFLWRLLGDCLPLAAARGDQDHVARWTAYRASLHAALETAGWDGAWYRRAYYDDGTPLGSAESDECRIDVLAQAWAVLSGVAPPGRAAAAMDAVERWLVDDVAGLVRLLTPPFDRTPHDPGYIKGYVPGIRENGGQYTHAAMWAVAAFAALGRRARAAELFERLTPVRQADAPAVYQVEPYVVAADVYGEPPHVGRGGWTWYTGSAGWMYRVAVESLLGLALEGGTALRVRPAIPDAWPGFRATLRLADGTRWTVDVVREGPGARVLAVRVDGRSTAVDADGARVPLVRDGGAHAARVVLGG
jgi:N,N'-diacetylchitobiose phosphorylase